MKVSALKAGTRTVPVVIPGEEGEPDDEVRITYRPGALTLDMMEESDGQRSADTLKKFLMDKEDPLIIGWTLEEDDGSPLPCTVENLGTLPLPFLNMVSKAIGEDSRPNPQTAGSSDAGSQQTEGSENALGGTESS